MIFGVSLILRSNLKSQETAPTFLLAVHPAYSLLCVVCFRLCLVLGELGDGYRGQDADDGYGDQDAAG